MVSDHRTDLCVQSWKAQSDWVVPLPEHLIRNIYVSHSKGNLQCVYGTVLQIILSNKMFERLFYFFKAKSEHSLIQSVWY